MQKQIEIEYKMILNKRQFMYIKKNYPFDYPFRQVNYYYDTESKLLSEKRYALRIRDVDGKYILTLKVPHAKGVMEYECDVPSLNFTNFELPQELLETLHFIDKDDLLCFGNLVTFRAVYQTDAAMICLDENFYHNRHDYEIEYEVKKEHAAMESFLAFLKDNGITTYRPAYGKSRRLKKAIHL